MCQPLDVVNGAIPHFPFDIANERSAETSKCR